MFLVLRPSLPTQVGGRHTPDTYSQHPWLNALAVALLPFFAYYASWGLLDAVKRDFILSYLTGVSFENRESLTAILKVKGIWIALAIAWAVRAFAKKRAAATGRGSWAVVATLCEAYWVFVGVTAIAGWMGQYREWWHSRAVYVAVADEAGTECVTQTWPSTREQFKQRVSQMALNLLRKRVLASE